MGKNKQLERAENHIFSTGLSDAGSVLARENMKYGIAKIHSLQSCYGTEPNAIFISAPDESPNKSRISWASGMSKGGKLVWGDGKEKLLILDGRPAVCGMLVGGLDRLPDTKKLAEKAHFIKDTHLELDGIPLSWDFGKGNHFIDVFSVKKLDGLDMPKYAFIIHASAPEFAADNPHGFGLCYDQSPLLSEMAYQEETPFGALHVLYDGEAEEYMHFHQYAESFAKRRRQVLAELLFGEFEELSNPTHQKLLNYNEMILGVYATEHERDTIFPLTLRADLPAYLVRGKQSFTTENLGRLGFEDRAKELGVYHKLKNANIIPHGAGMTLLGVSDVSSVFEVDGIRYFKMSSRKNVGDVFLSDVDNMPFAYRDARVVEKAVKLGMCELVAELKPECVLKI